MAQGSRGFMNSEYVCVGTPEENVLETFFVMTSLFNFERAREQCERERDIKSAGGGGANWCEFMSLLSRLSMAENSYYSLSFVGRSWLVKREQLSVVYESLLHELKKVHEIYHCRRGGTDFSWERKMAELVSSVMEYVSARKDLIGFYQAFSSLEGCHVDCIHSNHILNSIKERHNECFQHIFLKPVRQSFWSEVEVLFFILKAQISLSNWQFLPALFSLQNAQTKLNSWHGLHPPGLHVLSPNSSSNRIPSIRSRANSSPSSSYPPLYKWLCTFLNTLLSKFSVYFYDNLHTNGFLNDSRLLIQKFQNDYMYSFSILLKQAPPNSCVCLMFDSNGLENFKGPQYQVPGGTEVPKLTGLNSYPVMMSLPQEFDFLPHKANIVSMIMSQGTNSPSMGVSTQLDTKLHRSYHLAQVDVRVTMVMIIATIRGKGHETLVSHLIEIVSLLRLQDIIQALK